eukprot:15364624-Ditylum_brightwellii.AAC.1
MMIAANVTKEKRYKLFREAFSCATMLDWLVVIELHSKQATRVEHWCGMFPGWAKELRNWGETGVVKTQNNSTPKLENREITC